MKSVKTLILALLFLAIFTVSGLVGNAQTTLVTGDLAFSGYIANDAVPDQFSFVLLKNITTGTVIKFTDFGWRTAPLGFNSAAATESEMTFTATSNMNAGTEILIDGTTATKAGGGSAGTLVHTVGAAFNPTFSLAITGDQVFAFQGTFGTPGSITFIAGMHMNVETAPASTAATWDGTGATISGQTSEKPAALTSGTNANWFTTEVDNARFICASAPIGTVAQVRAALNSASTTPANWIANSTNPSGFTLPTGCGYLAPTAANVSVSGRVLTSDGRGIRNVIVVLTDQSGATRTARSSSFGYYRFDDVQVGETYVMSVLSKLYMFNSRVVTVADELTGVDFFADSP